MMASVSNHVVMIKHILKRSLNLALSRSNSSPSQPCVNETWQLLRNLFAMRNEEGCTALNLACGHGHSNMVKLLINSHRLLVCKNKTQVEVKIAYGNEGSFCEDVEDNASNDRQEFSLKTLVDVSYDDVNFCKATLSISLLGFGDNDARD